MHPSECSEKCHVLRDTDDLIDRFHQGEPTVLGQGFGEDQRFQRFIRALRRMVLTVAAWPQPSQTQHRVAERRRG